MCINHQNNICNPEIHKLLLETGCLEKNASYKGNLFKYTLSYPVFEGENCLQYIREYVPFHLPQIEWALEQLFENKDFMWVLNGASKVNILDLGSGPATVELAFIRLLNRIKTNIEFRFTALEASKTFINIIKKMSENLTSKVKIVDTINSDFYHFLNNCEFYKDKFDWIIMANFLSGIGQGKTFNETNNILNKFLSKIMLKNGYYVLTIIETKNTKFFDIPLYLNQLNNFESLEVVKEFRYFVRLNTNSPLNCCFYKTNLTKCTPSVNTKTLILKLK